MNEVMFQKIEQEQASRPHSIWRKFQISLIPIVAIDINSWRLHRAYGCWPHREHLRLHGQRLAVLRDCQCRAVESSCAGLLLPQRRAVPMGKGVARGKTFWRDYAINLFISLLFLKNEIESNLCNIQGVGTFWNYFLIHNASQIASCCKRR